MSSELLLSELLSEQGGILLKDWHYSTELRVLNTQLFYMFFYLLTHSWLLSRILAGIALFAVLQSSYAFLCRQAGLGSIFPLTAPLLFLPLTRDYVYIVLYGLFYIPHISISFFALGLLLKSEKEEKKKRPVSLVLQAILAFVAGLGGPRQLIILYLPLLLLALYRFWKSGKFCFIGVYLSTAAAGLGYLVNSRFLSRIYRFNGWNGLRFTEFSCVKLEQLIRGFFRNLGFVEAELSIAALAKCGIALFLAAAVFYALFAFLKDPGKRSEERRLLAGLAIAAFAVHILLYLFTDMFYQDRYWLPLLPYLMLPLAFALRDVKKLTDRILLFVCVLAVCIAGAWQIKELAAVDLTSSLKECTDALSRDGYESGYASYWNGNICTELSEGKLEMYNWDDHVDGIVDVDALYIWLQKLSHETAVPEGKCFILLSTQEETECPLVRYLTESEVAYRNSDYVAYGFADHEDMLVKLSRYTYELNDDAYLSGGECADGAWILHPGGSTTGPNMTLYGGTYHFTVCGSGVDELGMQATAGFGGTELEAQRLSAGDGEAQWELTVPGTVCHVEFRLFNDSIKDIKITYAKAER
ncbi:MAG: hypothetical protein IK115_10650 [Lachnospiraceae bacterium]|nr:hypothetical protein [Lachnospiraceae bacterium]